MNCTRIPPAAARRAVLIAALLAACLPGCSRAPEPEAGNGKTAAAAAQPIAPAARPVDAARLLAADTEPGNWMSTGRTWDEQRYSPLTGIDATNVARLGLAWFADLPTARGIQATPLVVDGVMYTTGAWSLVFAFDAANGKLLWQYDPQVPRVTAEPPRVEPS